MQNKTQPLPKNLIEKKVSDTQGNHYEGYGRVEKYGATYTESDSRPKI